jgi:hypothetical protein
MMKFQYVGFIRQAIKWFMLNLDPLAKIVQIAGIVGLVFTAFSYFHNISRQTNELKIQNDQTRRQMISNFLEINRYFSNEYQSTLDFIQAQSGKLGLSNLSCDTLRLLADSGKIPGMNVEDSHSLDNSIRRLLNLMQNIAIYYSFADKENEKEEEKIITKMYKKDIITQIESYRCFLIETQKNDKKYFLLDSIVKQWGKKD